MTSIQAVVLKGPPGTCMGVVTDGSRSAPPRLGEGRGTDD